MEVVFEGQKVFPQKEVRLVRRDIAPDRRRKGFQQMEGSLSAHAQDAKNT